MQAIIFNDTIDNSDPILTGKRIQRHILKADFQEAGKDLTLFPVQIMPVHGNAIHKDTVLHIEITTRRIRIGIRINPHIMKQAEQEHQMEICHSLIGIL